MPSKEYKNKWKGNNIFDECIPHVEGCLINAKSINEIKLLIQNFTNMDTLQQLLDIENDNAKRLLQIEKILGINNE